MYAKQNVRLVNSKIQMGGGESNLTLPPLPYVLFRGKNTYEVEFDKELKTPCWQSKSSTR